MPLTGLLRGLFFGRSPKQPIYKRGQLLSARPMRNDSIQWLMGEEEPIVTLLVPMRKKGFFHWISRIFRLPAEHQVELDALGSVVWSLCDGKHTVSAILERLMRQFKLERREAEVSLFAFLNTLAKRRYLAFQISKEPAARKKR